MKDALEPLNQTIALPGCTLTPTSLQFDGEPTDEQLTQVGLSLQRMETCRLWWWGDFLLALENRKGEHYTEQYADMAKLSRGMLKHCKMVSRFFKPCNRLHDLSWTHHHEAMLAVGTAGALEDANDWLELAQEKELKVSQLRKEIRLSKRDPQVIADAESDPGPPPERYVDVPAFARWCRQMHTKVADFPPRRALAILNDLRFALVFIDALYLRADGKKVPEDHFDKAKR